MSTKGDIAFILLFVAISLLILVDATFDIMGYRDSTKGVPVVKKFFGYIIGTMLLGFFISMLLRAFS